MAMRRVQIGTIGQPMVQGIVIMNDAEGAVFQHEDGFYIVVRDGNPVAETPLHHRPRTDIWAKWAPQAAPAEAPGAAEGGTS